MDDQPDVIDLGAIRRERGPRPPHVVRLGDEQWSIPDTDTWPAHALTLSLRGRLDEAFALALGAVEYEKFQAATQLTIADLRDLFESLGRREASDPGKSRGSDGSPRSTGAPSNPTSSSTTASTPAPSSNPAVAPSG